MDAIAAGAGFVAEMQRIVRFAQFRHRLVDHLAPVRDLAKIAHLTAKPVLGNRHGDCLFVHVESDKWTLLRVLRFLMVWRWFGDAFQ